MSIQSLDAIPAAAEAWLAANVADYSGPGMLEKFGFGQSNPTYRLITPDRDYVLRRKPLGELLPGAHAIEREYRVLSALASTNVPVPGALALCDDTALLGAAFFVMEHVEGRIFYDQRLPSLPPAKRTAIFDGMNAAVAALHLVDPEALELRDFGRTTGFLARQVNLWSQQYRTNASSLIPAMDKLIAWLPANLPLEQPPRIFHGDLRLDNMIFHPTEPRVIALLDWELSTLGDPIADFAYHMIVWHIGADLFRGLADLDLDGLGIPQEEEYVQLYCKRVGRNTLPNWEFYLAFALFRLAAILQGVWRRGRDGQASSPDAMEVGASAAPLADIGWRIAQRARI